MNKIVGVTEFQRNFKHVFDEVTKGKSAHILTRKSRPEAVLMPYDEYLRLSQLSESEVTSRFQRILARMRAVNARYSDEEIEHDLTQETISHRKTKRSHARRH